MFDVNFEKVKRQLGTNEIRSLLPSTSDIEVALSVRNGPYYTNLVNTALNGDTTYFFPYCAA
jgi:hypothetical protein